MKRLAQPRKSEKKTDGLSFFCVWIAVMGYFITFLLGPIQDCLTQRPYFYAGRVCCDDPCIRPALNQVCLAKFPRVLGVWCVVRSLLYA